MQGKSVFIHAGAHRTGTSSFQMCLALNRAVLAGQGYDVAYPTRDGLPGKGLALRLPHPRHGRHGLSRFTQGASQELARKSPDPDRALILSEENIPGRMIHFYAGQFYPASKLRFTILAEALAVRPRHLLFVTRSYDALFTSAFRKRAEDNPVPDFAQDRAKMADFKGGWPVVIRQMRDILRPDTMTVLDYSQRGSSADLLRRLVPDLAPVDLEEPTRTVNLSASDAALHALQIRYRAGETLARPDWTALIEGHKGQDAEHPFAAFTAEQAERLQARYAADMDEMSKLDGITLVT